MAQPIIFFNKSACDFQQPNVIATASEGNTYASYPLQRNNNIAWITSGSVDANNTTWTVDTQDPHTITDILLVLHNFKNYTVKYWNGSSFVNFSPAINVSGNTAATTYHQVASVDTSKLQITITGTQVPDSDKVMHQFIATSRIGQLQGWPVIGKPTIDRNRINTKMLSGKMNVAENVGGFFCKLSVASWHVDADLSIVETLYQANRGFLVWLCAGDPTQFWSNRQGYRMEDIVLMKCTNELIPEFNDGIYQRGMKIDIELAEVIG